MRILHVVPTYIPAYRYGGPIISVHGLCKGLVRLGHEVHVFTTNVDGNNDSDVPLGRPVDIDGVKIWYFPSNMLRRLYYSPPMQRALMRELNKFDLIHLHSIFLWPTWVAARIARKLGKPYIVSPRGMLVKDLIKKKNRWIKTAWLHLIERQTIENAAAIHFTSKVEEEEVLRFNLELQSTSTIPNGIDMDSDRISEAEISDMVKKLIERKPFLLFIGRINWKKGLDRLISAMSFLPDANLVIAGNDEERYTPVLESLAMRQGVRSRIVFTGPVYGNDKRYLLKHASLFVFPSYSENFGNVILESMAAGCPVVVTPEVGLADTVCDSDSGIVADGRPDIFGKSVFDLLSNPDRMRQMGMNGKKVVKKRFTWDVVAGQMERVYQNILDDCSEVIAKDN